MPNSASAASSAPGALSIRNTTDVRSAPVRAGGGARQADQDEAGAGVGLVDHAVGQGRQAPNARRPAARSPRRRPRPSATCRAASALEIRRPQFGAGQIGGQPLPHLCGGHREGRQRANVVERLRPGLTTMLNATSSVVSAKICSGDPIARLSSVGITEPSIEFSIGTHA